MPVLVTGMTWREWCVTHHAGWYDTAPSSSGAISPRHSNPVELVICVGGPDMITPAYVRMMAAYNAEMNRRLYAAAANLTDDQRREDRGAFFGSIHRTLGH